MLNTLNEGLHHAVTFDEFKNIIKMRRRNMSACRQSIDENKGAHRKLPVCTTFKAPVLCEDEGAANIAAAAAARVQTMRRTERLQAKAKRELRKKNGIVEDDQESQSLREPTASARRSAMEEEEAREEDEAEAAEDALANERLRMSQSSALPADSESTPNLGGSDGIVMRPTESTAMNAVHLPPLNSPKGADTI